MMAWERITALDANRRSPQAAGGLLADEVAITTTLAAAPIANVNDVLAMLGDGVEQSTHEWQVVAIVHAA